MELCRYQPFDGRDGLRLDGATLSAWRGGKLLATASAPPGALLEELLRSYRLPELFPDLVFTHTEPATYLVLIDYSYTLTHRREIHGWLTFEGTRFRWIAKWRKLPKGAGSISPDRPWLHAEEVERGEGLEFHLPPPLANHPDPVVVRRLALAIEAFVFALRDGWPIDIPFRYQFDNLFSQRQPIWQGEGPAVTTAWQSPLLRAIDWGTA
jgi:hypothetical protein